MTRKKFTKCNELIIDRICLLIYDLINSESPEDLKVYPDLALATIINETFDTNFVEPNVRYHRKSLKIESAGNRLRKLISQRKFLKKVKAKNKQ